MSATDPICGMAVEESKAAATYNYKGRTYYFCNIRCKEKFEKDPEAALSLAHIPHPTSHIPTEGMAKDPICGMVVEKDRSCSGRYDSYMGSDTSTSIFYMGCLALHPCYAGPIYRRLDILCWRVSRNKNQNDKYGFPDCHGDSGCILLFNRCYIRTRYPTSTSRREGCIF